MNTKKYQNGHQPNKLRQIQRAADPLQEHLDTLQAREIEQHWRQVLHKFAASGLSGAEYCRRNGITYQYFADWRLKIRKADASGKAIGHRAMRKALSDEKPKPQGSESSHRLDKSVEFAAVKVIGQSNPNQERQTGNPARLELVFPSGVVLRLPDDCSLTLLSSVISILEKR